ncbi:MAG: hypothetical protein EBR27_12605 [Betaproteobacteria bacterium]|nr:hypothetical protein [Betaproteobacteria bacterium]
MGSKIIASNFSFLQGEWPALFIEATKAERGVMEPSLLYEPPFTGYAPRGPEALFTSAQVEELFGVLDDIKASASVA